MLTVSTSRPALDDARGAKSLPISRAGEVVRIVMSWAIFFPPFRKARINALPENAVIGRSAHFGHHNDGRDTSCHEYRHEPPRNARNKSRGSQDEKDCRPDEFRQAGNSKHVAEKKKVARGMSVTSPHDQSREARAAERSAPRMSTARSRAERRKPGENEELVTCFIGERLVAGMEASMPARE